MITSTRPRGVGHRTAHDPGDPLVTSHCPFCGSGQVVGRSDGTIGCDFCGQNYIVRVQPAFPGMPQMPMGPGAPSDIGPDGGLVDPGMVGPDGMPVDDGGPPPEDAAAEGGPEGLPDDGEELPPPGDDGGDDATPSGPPPGKKSDKGKNKKKSARFRGVEGQHLTEEQLVRHLAVRMSGAHPVVMARLRAEGAARRTAATGEAHYRTLSTGHQVSIGRLGRDWYGVIRHPQSSQVHYMHLGQGHDPHAEAERQLGAGLARSFIHATTPGDQAGAAGMPVQEPPGAWYRGQGPGHAPSDWRPAQASRGRRPFGEVRAVRVERDHEGMSEDELRQHMRHSHGFIDTADDPDWVIEETHRNEHADGNDDHMHPDLEDEYGEDIHLGDQDWMRQNGIEPPRSRW
jgi:hypothetical protein